MASAWSGAKTLPFSVPSCTPRAQHTNPVQRRQIGRGEQRVAQLGVGGRQAAKRRGKGRISGAHGGRGRREPLRRRLHQVRRGRVSGAAQAGHEMSLRRARGGGYRRSMPLRSVQCTIVARQGKGLRRKVGMLPEKPAHGFFVFLGGEGAGAVHQPSAGAQHSGRTAQDTPLPLGTAHG